MKATINEEGIMKVEALVMSKAICSSNYRR